MADFRFLDVAKSAREISFDRFVTPAFYFGGIANLRLTINATNIIVRNNSLGSVASVTLNNGGTGYQVGDILTISNGDNNATITVESLVGTSTVISTFSLTEEGTNCSVSTGNNTSGGHGTGCRINITAITPKEVLNFLIADYPTLQDLSVALLTNSEGIPFSYAASFIGTEPTSSLLRLTNINIAVATPIYRTYFFGDAVIDDLVRKYCIMQLGMNEETVMAASLDDVISEIKASMVQHMVLWTAFYLVDKRRLYEIAADALGQSTFSFSSAEGLMGAGNTGGNVSMKIGDVFSLEDTLQTEYNEGERPWAVGADNVLGDAQTFWYKLQLWIRQNFETLFGDFSLRRNNVLEGRLELSRDQNFYAFYDQYPYTVSPLARDILSSMSRL